MRDVLDWLADTLSGALGAVLAWLSRWLSVPTSTIWKGAS
jgi:hypothetical protein